MKTEAVIYISKIGEKTDVKQVPVSNASASPGAKRPSGIQSFEKIASVESPDPSLNDAYGGS